MSSEKKKRLAHKKAPLPHVCKEAGKLNPIMPSAPSFSPATLGRAVPCSRLLPSPGAKKRGHDIHELTRVPFYEVSVKTKT